MHSKNINKIAEINDYINLGINNYRLELFDENYKELENLINELRKKMNINV